MGNVAEREVWLSSLEISLNAFKCCLLAELYWWNHMQHRWESLFTIIGRKLEKWAASSLKVTVLLVSWNEKNSKNKKKNYKKTKLSPKLCFFYGFLLREKDSKMYIKWENSGPTPAVTYMFVLITSLQVNIVLILKIIQVKCKYNCM